MKCSKLWVLGLLCVSVLAGCFGPDSEGNAGSGGATGGSGGSGGAACECDDALDCCGSACVNLSNDVLNCGSCGNICPGPNQFCDDGVCGTPPCEMIAALRAAPAFPGGAGGAGGGAGFAGSGDVGGNGGTGGGCFSGDEDAGAAAGAGGGAGDGSGFAGPQPPDAGGGADQAGAGGIGGAAGAAGIGGSSGIGGTGGTCGEPVPLPPDMCCGATACPFGSLCCVVPSAASLGPQCVVPINGTCPAS